VPRRRGESADQNPGSREMIEPIAFIWSLKQAEQMGTAEHPEACPLQRMIQTLSIHRKARPGRSDPSPVAQRQHSNLTSRTGYGPVTKHMMPRQGVGLCDNRKADAQSGKTKELAERAQYHDTCRQFGHREQRGALRDLGKGLIDDQATSGCSPNFGKGNKLGARQQAAVGIVGIDDNERFEVAAPWVGERRQFRHLSAGFNPGGSMRPIGRRQDANSPRRQQAWQ